MFLEGLLLTGIVTAAQSDAELLTMSRMQNRC